MFRVGLLSDSVQAVEGLKEGLRDLGYREGETYVIEQRKVEGRFDMLPVAVRSLLDEVPGVGPAKKRALLRKFGSVRGMREAHEADLAAVAGVGPALARKIKDALET